MINHDFVEENVQNYLPDSHLYGASVGSRGHRGRPSWSFFSSWALVPPRTDSRLSTSAAQGQGSEGRQHHGFESLEVDGLSRGTGNSANSPGYWGLGFVGSLGSLGWCCRGHEARHQLGWGWCLVFLPNTGPDATSGGLAFSNWPDDSTNSPYPQLGSLTELLVMRLMASRSHS